MPRKKKKEEEKSTKNLKTIHGAKQNIKETFHWLYFEYEMNTRLR